MRSWISFLVTGPEANLMAWQLDAMYSIELFDRRGQTVRCRAHAVAFMDFDAWKTSDATDMTRAKELVSQAVELAKKHDVTVQELPDDEKSYPVLTLGSHGMKWGKE